MSKLIECNVTSPLNIFIKAQRYHVTPFINSDTFFNVGNLVCQYMPAYSSTKHCFKSLALEASKSMGAPFVNMRIEHMYGEGEDPSKFCSRVISACSNNTPCLSLTKGEQLRDFVHVDDVVSAFIAVCRNILSGRPVLTEYEIGCGEAISVRSFVEMAHRIKKSTTKLIFGAVPYLDGEPMKSQANISPLLDLDWRPSVCLQEGISRYDLLQGGNST